MYDSKIGRWLSPDPAGQYHSPYLAFGNNPISRTDPDGGTDGDFGEGCNCIDVEPGPHSTVDIYGNIWADLPDGGYGMVYYNMPTIPTELSYSINDGMEIRSSSNDILRANFDDKMEYTGLGLGTIGGGLTYIGNYQPNFPIKKPFSKLIPLGTKVGNLGTFASVVGVGYSGYQAYESGSMVDWAWFGYDTFNAGASIGAGYLAGGPAGVAVGTAGTGTKMWFEIFFKYIDRLGKEIGSMEYHIKNNRWNPQYMFGIH